jgi:hypothetical protein
MGDRVRCVRTPCNSQSWKLIPHVGLLSSRYTEDCITASLHHCIIHDSRYSTEPALMYVSWEPKPSHGKMHQDPRVSCVVMRFGSSSSPVDFGCRLADWLFPPRRHDSSHPRAYKPQPVATILSLGSRQFQFLAKPSCAVSVNLG